MKDITGLHLETKQSRFLNHVWDFEYVVQFKPV